MIKLGNIIINLASVKKIEYKLYESTPYAVVFEFLDGTHEIVHQTHVAVCPDCRGHKRDVSAGGDSYCETCDDTGFVNMKGDIADSDFRQLVKVIDEKLIFAAKRVK